jgi:hypothetical protein
MRDILGDLQDREGPDGCRGSTAWRHTVRAQSAATTAAPAPAGPPAAAATSAVACRLFCPQTERGRRHVTSRSLSLDGAGGLFRRWRQRRARRARDSYACRQGRPNTSIAKRKFCSPHSRGYNKAQTGDLSFARIWTVQDHRRSGAGWPASSKALARNKGAT